MQAAVQQLQEMGIRLQDGWARTAWAEGANTRDQLLSHFLWSDMMESSVGCLPQNWEGQTQLQGRFVLQLNEVVNVGAPARDRYKETSGSKRCLKLALTDGKCTAWAMELHSCGALSTNLTAGCKVAVTDPVVHAGLIMLMGASIRVLGGGVDRLEAARQRLLEHWNQPLGCSLLSVQNRGTAEQMFQEARQAAWPHLQQQQPMQHQNAPAGAIITAGAGMPAAPQPQPAHLNQQAAAPMHTNMDANAPQLAPNHMPLNQPAQNAAPPWQHPQQQHQQQQPMHTQAAPNIPQLPQARNMAMQGGAQLNTFATHKPGVQGPSSGVGIPQSNTGLDHAVHHAQPLQAHGAVANSGAAHSALNPSLSMQCSAVAASTVSVGSTATPQHSAPSTFPPRTGAGDLSTVLSTVHSKAAHTSARTQLQQQTGRNVVNLADSDDDIELDDEDMGEGAGAGGVLPGVAVGGSLEPSSQATASYSAQGSGVPTTQTTAPSLCHMHAEDAMEWVPEEDDMDAAYMSEEEAEPLPSVVRPLGTATPAAADVGVGCSTANTAGSMAAAAAAENCNRAGNGGGAPLVQTVRDVAAMIATMGGVGKVLALCDVPGVPGHHDYVAACLIWDDDMYRCWTFLHEMTVRASFVSSGPELYEEGTRKPCGRFNVPGELQDSSGTLNKCMVSPDFLVQQGCGNNPGELIMEMTHWKRQGWDEEDAPMVACLETTMHVMEQGCLLCVERRVDIDKWIVSIADEKE